MFRCCDGTGHRHSIHCIVPPHVLREIAQNGDPAERRSALDTLAHDVTHRDRRARMTLMQAMMPVSATGPFPFRGTPVVHRQIFDVSGGPPRLVRAEGQAEGPDTAVNEAYDGLGHTFDFYLKTYRRNSIDNRGLWLLAYVHYGHGYDNAFWNGQAMYFGDGSVFNRLTYCLDVIGHELTHGVTQYEAGLAYQDQSGALNESISDVFGSLIKQYVLKQTASDADWLIGRGLIKKYPDQSLRSMKAPGTAYDNPLLGKDPQPGDMSHYVDTGTDNGGVHINSGIPNLAFYLAATAIGGHAWEKAGQIWYDTVRDPELLARAETATFADFATLTVKHATQLYGTGPEEAATRKAWN